MRLRNSAANLVAALALLLGLVPGGRAQTQQPQKAGQKTQKVEQKPQKVEQKTQKVEQKSRKAGQKPPKAQAPAATEAAKEPAATISRRDPFEPLVSRQRPGGESLAHLPPGKAGLVIGTLRVDGIVRAPNGMIAVVTNPQQRVYFLREGDRLYNGRVERITRDGVSFHESGKDAFGKPLEREVTKRLYPSAGEQP